MTPRTKWVTLPLSLTAATAILSAGIAIGHALEVQAQFVTRAEYTENRSDVRLRFLRDSLTREAQHSEEIVRLARIERVLYKMACHDFPTECDK